MNNLEPVNSRQGNLSPRAKIGDVVITKTGSKVYPLQQMMIERGLVHRTMKNWSYVARESVKHSPTYIYDKDILKNLTTNVSYEKV